MVSGPSPMTVPSFDFSPPPEDMVASHTTAPNGSADPHRIARAVNGFDFSSRRSDGGDYSTDEEDSVGPPPFNPSQIFTPSSFPKQQQQPLGGSVAAPSSPPGSSSVATTRTPQSSWDSYRNYNGNGKHMNGESPPTSPEGDPDRERREKEEEEAQAERRFREFGTRGAFKKQMINGIVTYNLPSSATTVNGRSPVSPTTMKGPGNSPAPRTSTDSAPSPDDEQVLTVPSSFPLSNSHVTSSSSQIGSLSGRHTNKTTSLSARQRPSNLPLPDQRSNGLTVAGPTGNTPSWPFINQEGHRLDLSNLASPAVAPLTPSAINPIYGAPPGEDQGFPLGANPYMPASEPGGKAAAVIGVSSGALAGSKGKATEPRHFYKPSEGTHSLLSSRSNSVRPLAAAASQNLHFDSVVAWLIYYFIFNLGLTLWNKGVMISFPFGWTVTGVHTLCGTIGSRIALERGWFKQSELGLREHLVLIMFSVLYTVNIAVSTLSMGLVTVPFHQVVRAMTPLFTIILSTAFLRKRYSRATYISLLPVVCGVAFATFGEYDYTAWGFTLTLFGAVLAAIKTVVTNLVLVGRLKLHPLDLLLRMSPLAFIQSVLWSWSTGELERLREYGATQMTRKTAILLLMNGIFAFGLNVVSFTANKKTSALTMTVAANVKQVLTIVLAVVVFNTVINTLNFFGITLTIIGGAWYAKIEFGEKNRKARAMASPSPLGAKQALS